MPTPVCYRQQPLCGAAYSLLLLCSVFGNDSLLRTTAPPPECSNNPHKMAGQSTLPATNVPSEQLLQSTDQPGVERMHHSSTAVCVWLHFWGSVPDRYFWMISCLNHFPVNCMCSPGAVSSNRPPASWSRFRPILCNKPRGRGGSKNSSAWLDHYSPGTYSQAPCPKSYPSRCSIQTTPASLVSAHWCCLSISATGHV